MRVETCLYDDAAGLQEWANGLDVAPVAIIAMAAGLPREDIAAAVSAIRGIWPQIDVIGTTAAMLIQDGVDRPVGLSVTLICSDSMTAESMAIGLGSVSEDRGAVAAKLLQAKCGLAKTNGIFCFSHLTLEESRPFANNMAVSFGDAPMIGGKAAAASGFESLIWHNERFIDDGAVALIMDDADLAIWNSWFLGLKGIGNPLEVTATDDQYVTRLNRVRAMNIMTGLAGTVFEKQLDVLRRSMPIVAMRGGLPFTARIVDIHNKKGLKVDRVLRKGEKVSLHAEHPARINEELHNIALRALSHPGDAVFYFSAASRLKSHFRSWQESKMLRRFGPITGAWLEWEFVRQDGQNRTISETASVTFVGRRGAYAAERLKATDFPMPAYDRQEHHMYEMLIDLIDRSWRTLDVQVAQKEDERLRYRTVLENMSDGVSILTADGISVYESRTNKEIHGFESEDLLGQNFVDVIVHAEDREQVIREWARALQSPGEVFTTECRCIAASGKSLIIQAQIRNCLQEENVRGMIITFRDITDVRRIEDELRRQATIDGLTGVANRRHFSDVAQKEIMRSKRYGHDLCFIIFDIDHFKRFNDNYGHQTGDDVLLLVASLVSTLVRKTDLVGRLGGEEFGVLMPETTIEAAMDKAEMLREVIAAEPLDVGEEKLTITASFGVSALDADEAFDNMMHRADMALYKSKENGRDRVTQAVEGVAE